MDFPTIDLQNFSLEQFDKACRSWGSFALLGHDIPTQHINSAFNLAQTFFHLPQAAKYKIRRSADNAWGYYDAELTKNRRDWKEIIDIGPPATDGPLKGAYPQWPAIEGFQDEIQTLTTNLHDVALKIVDLVEHALASPIALRPAFDDHSSFLRINYYPPCPNPAPPDAERDTTNSAEDAGELGIGEHTDAGAVTVLVPDNQPGLQFRFHNRWHTVVPATGAVVVNIGDIVQVWSNNRYCAPVHRVLANSTHPRYSIPYFLNPSYTYNYAPLSPSEPPQYRPINWGEFRHLRSAGDYADQGQEVQISDYALTQQNR